MASNDLDEIKKAYEHEVALNNMLDKQVEEQDRTIAFLQEEKLRLKQLEEALRTQTLKRNVRIQVEEKNIDDEMLEHFLGGQLEKVHGYTQVELIGKGGFGKVYKCNK